MKNTLTKIIFHTCLFFILFSSCSEKAPQNIRIGVLDGPSSVSFIQLYDNPQKIGDKKIEFIIKSDPQQIQALMMKNELDFAVLPTVMAANLYNKDVKYKAVAFPVWGTLYIVTNNKNIQNLAQLHNNTIAVFGQGATPDVLLQRYIEEKKLRNVQIDYTYTGNNELAGALLSGKVQIAVISEPQVSNLIIKNPDIRVLSKLDCEEYIFNTDIDIFAQTAFLVNTSFADHNNDIVEEVCELYSASCNFINNEPDMAAELLVKHKMITDTETAKKSLPLCNIRYVGAFAVEKEVMRYLNIFYEFAPESIGGKLPNRNFIYQPE